MKPRDLVAGVASAALLAVTPVFAQQQGSTSGPAVGTTVAPNAAAEKQNPNQETGGVSPGGAVGAGSPGATARSGTQGGPPPDQSADRRRDTDRDRGWDRGRDEARCECRDRDWRPRYGHPCPSDRMILDLSASGLLGGVDKRDSVSA